MKELEGWGGRFVLGREKERVVVAVVSTLAQHYFLLSHLGDKPFVREGRVEHVVEVNGEEVEKRFAARRRHLLISMLLFDFDFDNDFDLLLTVIHDIVKERMGGGVKSKQFRIATEFVSET